MADFDGDSTLDILVINRNEGQIFRLKHDPNNFLYLVGLPTYLSQLAPVLTFRDRIPILGSNRPVSATKYLGPVRV